jgi:hypothetical protein
MEREATSRDQGSGVFAHGCSFHASSVASIAIDATPRWPLKVAHLRSKITSKEASMSRNLQTTLGIILGIFLMLFIGVCSLAAFARAGVGCTLETGRDVAVSASGWSCGLASTKDTATIDAAGHKIVVAPQFLQVDGRRVATIDSTIKSINVDATKRTISFVGDGRTIAIWRR